MRLIFCFLSLASLSALASAEVTIYEKASVSGDYITQSNAPSLTKISSNTSRIGFKGKEDLGNMNLIWQVETHVAVDEGNEGEFALRNSFVGFANDNMSIKLGKHDTPYKLLGYKMPQILGGSIGDVTGFTGIFHRVDQRPSNAVLFQAKRDHLDFGYMYATKEETMNNVSINSMGLNYATKNYGAQIGWQENKNAKYDSLSLPNNTMTAQLFAGFVKPCNTVQISAGFENIRDNNHQLNKLLMAAYTPNPQFKTELIYSQSNQEVGNEFGRAYEIVLAAEYNLSKSTSIPFGVGLIQNQNTNINLGANWLPLPLAKDTDIRFYTLGIKHSF